MRYKLITKKEREEAYNNADIFWGGAFRGMKEITDDSERTTAKTAFMRGIDYGYRLTCNKYSISQEKFNQLQNSIIEKKKEKKRYNNELVYLKMRLGVIIKNIDHLLKN